MELLERNPDELRFLYRKCSVKQFQLSYWINSVPEFYDRVLDLKNNSESIDDKVLLSIMKEIYDTKYQDAKTSGCHIEFYFRLARQSINQLERAVELKGG